MGYCIDVSGEVTIKKENIPLAINRLKEIMITGEKEKAQHGASNFFSWVNTDVVTCRLEVNDLCGALAEWRYRFSPTKEGSLEFGYFTGEKWGDDERLWEALAPAIDSSSFVEYCGEDGHRWRYLFEDGKVKEQNAVITWE